MVTADYVTVGGGTTTLDFQIKDFPLVAGEVFLADNVSIRNVTGTTAAAAALASGPTRSAPGDLVPLRPTLCPSPLRSQGTLRFATSRSGMLRVQVVDLAGRRVRQLLDATDAPAGEHELPVDGRGDNGQPLSPGIYFFRIQAQEGLTTGRFVILR